MEPERIPPPFFLLTLRGPILRYTKAISKDLQFGFLSLLHQRENILDTCRGKKSEKFTSSSTKVLYLLSWSEKKGNRKRKKL